MKKNLGAADIAIRTLAAIAIGVLLLTGVLTGTLGIVLGIVGVILILTGVIGFCPLYFVLRLSTRRESPAA